jgi:ubiquinone/menaquinone biosynthesis C-methylase UbiE
MTDNVQTAYTQWSTTYDTDRNLTRDLDQTVTRTVLHGHRFEAILEAGCGTGKNTQFLAEIGDRVEAIDFSEGMLKQARRKVFGTHVTFRQADLTQPWPMPDASVQLVTTNLVLEHIADLHVVFREAARVLQPNSQMFVCELHPFKQYTGSKAVFHHDSERVEPTAYVHHTGAFWEAATRAGLHLIDLREWWHPEDQNTPPRLLSLMFQL